MQDPAGQQLLGMLGLTYTYLKHSKQSVSNAAEISMPY